MRSYWILLLGLLWAQDGKALFQANCASCHAINRRVVGPALKGVHERWGGDEAEMTKFIKNSQAYINGNFKNSAYAKKLYEQYNKAVMTAFTGLSDAEIKSILDYIKAESQAQETTAAAAPSNAGTGAAGGGGAEVVSPILWVLVLALGAIAIALLITTLALSKLLRPETEASAVPSTTREGTIRKILRSRSFIGLVSVGAFIWLMNATIKKARSVGLHKGYQPVQPIAFSHKTHAGEYKIACQYCHVGVEKGKSATIPSTNICMNCHTYIQEGSRYGKKEIAKILASWEQGKPIEWVRIHNLPDFVYFSHAQHVKVGGIACQTCHGPVQEMEEVYQYSDLSMGWCLDCHRKTKVDLTANPYYARLHEQLKEKEVTVEKIGGLECSKCHY